MKIEYSEYYDKVYGCWFGKCAGGMIGFKQENNKNLLNYNFENIFPDHTPPNDDFDLQILWMDKILEQRGFDFDAYELADTFAKYNMCWANEYRIAIRNILLGVYPPESGLFDNEFFMHSMGCPIRSEIWGLICPMEPEKAARYAEYDGSIDHASESIDAEKFLAAMESLAFNYNNIKKLIENSLKYLTPETRLYSCINKVMEYYNSGFDWKDTRNKLVREFGSCDASYSVINLGFVTLALLYGKNDFTNTMITAVNCGFDTDCTAATSGAVLGLILGFNAIPNVWKEKVGEQFVIGTVDVNRERDTLKLLAEDTCKLGTIPKTGPSICFSVDYKNGPVIYPNIEKAIDIILENLTPETMNIVLEVNFPGNISYLNLPGKVVLEPGKKLRHPLAFKSSLVNGRLPERNIVGFRLTVNGKYSIQRKVGLVGGTCYKVLGPFWDNYDNKKYDHDIYNDLQQKDLDGNADIFAMFNGFVNIDREYIPEEFGPETEINGDTYYASSDILDIGKIVTYQGPCCLYLVRDIYLNDPNPEDVQFIIGNSGPYKIWVNGKLVSTCKEPTYWTTQNYFVFPELKPGKNRIVYKIVNINGAKFSNIISHTDFKNNVYVDIDNIYSE
ncbi:MAG: ADP-ribosylglycohydrolase family protein [Clostridiales bacterium]|jgi:ADP-ribosylglycohydrolase|nr:ADP-ribosylglycohydrolase family protein [Clostridiales bacterium]